MSLKRFTSGLGRAKLGFRQMRAIWTDFIAAGMPTIPLSESILIEYWTNWDHLSPLQDNSIPISMGGNIISCRNGVTDNLYTYFNLVDLYAITPHPRGCTYLAVLVDKTGGIGKLYLNGVVADSHAITSVPDFSGAVWNLVLNYWIYNCCHVWYLFRITTMVSCPVDIDDALRRMYHAPMALDASCDAVKSAIATQYDFQDPVGSVSAILEDHGVIGGHPATCRGGNFSSCLEIVEKP